MSWREQESCEWFTDLEMLIRFLDDKDQLIDSEKFGERLKRVLEEGLKKETFCCNISCDFFSIRVFKNGNVELKFNDSYQDLLNWGFESCKKVSLKQFIMIKNLKEYVFSDSNKYAKAFNLQRLDESQNPVMFFELWSKENKKPYDGYLKIHNNLVEVEIREGNDELIASNKLLERNVGGNLYKGLIEYLKQTGSEIDRKIRAQKVIDESIEFEKDEIQRKLELLNVAKEQSKYQKLEGKIAQLFDNSDHQLSEFCHEDGFLRFELTQKIDPKFLVKVNISNVIHLEASNGCIMRVPIECDDIEKIYKVFLCLWGCCLMTKNNESNVSLEPTSNNCHEIVENSDTNVIYLPQNEKFENAEISIEIKEDGSIFVTGNTKPVKEDLKKFKLAWSRKLKVWYVPGSRKRAYCEQTKKHLHDLRCLLESKGVIVTSYVANM